MDLLAVSFGDEPMSKSQHEKQLNDNSREFT